MKLTKKQTKKMSTKSIRENHILIPIESINDLKENMNYVEPLLQQQNDYIFERVKKGKNFVYYKYNGQERFLPSRFVGYKNISIDKHKNASKKDGKITSQAINKILGKKVQSQEYENKLKNFLQTSFGENTTIDKSKHSFWITNICLTSENTLSVMQLEEKFDSEVAKINLNRTCPPDFSLYGKVKKYPVQKSKLVIYSDRDPQVVADALWLAKGVCQGCGADKEKLFYRASDESIYLEVHHIKPLSEHGSDTLDNACALCPICHRLLHYGKKSDQDRILKRINKMLKEREKYIKELDENANKNL